MKSTTNGLTAARAALFAAALGALSGCGGEDAVVKPKGPATPPPKATTSATATPATTAAPDASDERPHLAPPTAFNPPAPSIWKVPVGSVGMKLWLLERRTLPLVSATITFPRGSASDPLDKPGLAHITADMLDEGAGSRSAVELSSAINDLGASIESKVTADGISVTLTVLKKNFAAAFGLLSDIVARPRFEPKEWKRVHGLWKNALTKRADDPEAVSRVVTAAAQFGPEAPYGHPAEGLLRGAKAIDLPDVKAFYKDTFVPIWATLVVVGDVSREEVNQAVAAGLDGWKAEKDPTPLQSSSSMTGWKAPRLVIVDRPKAPQSVISVAREGVAVNAPLAPLLELINTALGGSFTSRLNQNLREDHGYTYGAHSAFTESRYTGMFVARAAVHTEVTGAALKEMLGELSKMAADGPSRDEVVKASAQDRAELVQTYESVTSSSVRLGRLSVLGLQATFDADATRIRQTATAGGLKLLASAVDPKAATVVIVGPLAEIGPQLAGLGLGEPSLWDADGAPKAQSAVGAAPATPAKADAPAAKPTKKK